MRPLVFLTELSFWGSLELAVPCEPRLCVKGCTLIYNGLLFTNCDLDGESSHWHSYHISLFLCNSIISKKKKKISSKSISPFIHSGITENMNFLMWNGIVIHFKRMEWYQNIGYTHFRRVSRGEIPGDWNPPLLLDDQCIWMETCSWYPPFCPGLGTPFLKWLDLPLHLVPLSHLTVVHKHKHRCPTNFHLNIMCHKHSNFI